MVEYDRTLERDLSALPPFKICVAGVGGAGLNVLDRIALDRIVDATLVGMHTDVRVLTHAMTQHKVQLGAELMRGIGSGGDPELGRTAAESSRETILSLLRGHDMIFICAGLGGGTGSGAVPVVAEIAKSTGALVLVFATTPFSFEGRRRLLQSDMALDEIQRYADALILFENNRMGEMVVPREGIQKAFSQADQLIGHSVRAIGSMVTQPGLVRLGLSDLVSALRNPNARCLFGFGEARGTNRSSEALKRALKSPLIHQGQLLQQAQNLIVHVAGGDSLTLMEVELLMKQLGKHVPDETQILFGISVDPKLGDSLVLTLLSSVTAEQIACEIMPSVKPEPATVHPIARPAAVVAPAATATTTATEDDFHLPQTHRPAIAAESPAPPPAVAPRRRTPLPHPPVDTEPVESAPPKSRPAPVATPAPPKRTEPVEPPVPLKASIFSVVDDDEEEDAPEEPEAPPALPPRPARTTPSQPKASFVPPPRDEEPEEEPEEDAEPVGHSSHSTLHRPEPALAAAGGASSLLQSTLNLHPEEIARFKGTDKTIVEGEDLDVPTWMRMRKKMGR